MRITQHRIAFKLFLAMVGYSLLFTAAGTGLQLYRDYIRGVHDLEGRIHQINKSYVPAIAHSLWLVDQEMLQVEAKGIQYLPGIQYVEVFADGKEIIALGNGKTEGRIRHEFPLRYTYKNKEVALGTLVVHANLAPVYQHLYDQFFVILATQLTTIALLSSLLFILFYFLVGRHLHAMAEYLEALGPDNMDQPLVLDKKPSGTERMDELEQVVFSFNEMRQNLKESLDTLHQVNSELHRENIERLRAENSLRESEQRYSLLVNNIQEVFWLISPDYQEVFFVSPAYEKIWGRTCESLIAQPNSWLDAVVDEDKKTLAAVIAAIGNDLGSPEIDFPEYRIRRPDGTLRWIQAKGVALKDDEGKFWAIAGVCADISDRREAEEKLRQGQKMEAIGTLAGGIAHDFNNILAAILGYADLTRSEMSDADPHRRYIDEIIQAGNRAKALTQQILAFGRKSLPQPRPVLVGHIVKEVLQLIRASIPTTIAIEPHIEDANATVLADPVQIHQVTLNLCTNAAQAMEQKGGTLTVSLEEVLLAPDEAAKLDGKAGNYVVLTVSDTGCGMNHATLERIFDPYFTTKDIGKGSGMGLAVVHGIVQSYGGMIRVRSTEGVGTTFQLYLPTTDQKVEEHKEPVAALYTGQERILLVDDEPSIIDLGQRLLTRLGYRVTAFTSSMDALNLVRSDPSMYDLVITDQTMPLLPGSELAKEILKVRPDMPIILCTGYSTIVDEKQALTSGIRKYLLKPYQSDELAQTVRQALDEPFGSSEKILA